MSEANLLAHYEDDNVLRARIAEMYLHDRSRFIASLIKLAYSLGATRDEAVEFANAVTRRIKATAASAEPVSAARPTARNAGR
jgi:hypothetical protein